jgi:hypothetical protein
MAGKQQVALDPAAQRRRFRDIVSELGRLGTHNEPGSAKQAEVDALRAELDAMGVAPGGMGDSEVDYDDMTLGPSVHDDNPAAPPDGGMRSASHPDGGF